MNQEDIKRFNKIVEKLRGKVSDGEHKFKSLCPHHDDTRTSLGIRLCDNGVILMNCLAGCAISDVCESLGITLGTLYPTAQIVDLFDFIDLDHVLQYQEVKFDETAQNRFQARRPGKKKGEWDYDIIGKVQLILYNWFAIHTAPKDAIIFMCEGCKDARTLIHKALFGTAALMNNWVQTDTSSLDGRLIVILVDNDEAGEVKAFRAANDRCRKSSSIKLLRLPGLKPGGDVTDWFELGGENTVEKLIELAMSNDLPLWHPLESTRKQVANKKLTGLSFEHQDPRPSFDFWNSVYHPPEEGLLYLYDGEYLKGNMRTLLYEQISKNPRIIESMYEFFSLCYNAKSKKGEDLFKPTPQLISMILEAGNSAIDLDAKRNTSLPIYNPFFQNEKIGHYESDDVILMKSENFYIPERVCFPRNMEQCIAIHALPFDYDEKATCPEIQTAFNIQWGSESNESTTMLLQFLYYYMLHTFKYKAILDFIGEGNTGKSVMLDLIRAFVGIDSCAALGLGKIGKQFELYPARHCKLLICDDVNLTRRDLQEGAVIENIKSIASGAIIRMEKKNGELIYRRFGGQMLLAGNNPPLIQEFSNALSNRFYFLVFPHEFIQGKGMNTDVLGIWLPELSGLMNLALDAGPSLIAQDGFIEPRSSWKAREKFEGGGNRIKKYVYDNYDINDTGDKIKWHTRPLDFQAHYKLHCEETSEEMLRTKDINNCLEAIQGIERATLRIKITDTKTKEPSWKSIRVWEGMRKKGTSGIIGEKDLKKVDEF